MSDFKCNWFSLLDFIRSYSNLLGLSRHQVKEIVAETSSLIRDLNEYVACQLLGRESHLTLTILLLYLIRNFRHWQFLVFRITEIEDFFRKHFTLLVLQGHQQQSIGRVSSQICICFLVKDCLSIGWHFTFHDFLSQHLTIKVHQLQL